MVKGEDATSMMSGMKYNLIVILFVSLAVGLMSSAYSAGGAEADRSSMGSSAAYPEGAVVIEKIIELPGLKNVGRVAPNIYRGAQPERAGYETLRKMGIRTVINLRTTKSEKDEVEAAGMRYVEIPMSMLSGVDREKVDHAVDVMADPGEQPVFVHCRLGHDRTGIVVAAYRMREEGWTLQMAEAEMEEYGFNDVWLHFKSFLKEYSEHYRER
ncbi:MAG: tyrosine-protein phosphatase [Nitrospirota bacterium]